MISLKDRKKIILGTASFDKNYGINKSIFFKKDEKNSLLKKCVQNKILYIDCSENYNSAMSYFYQNKGILKKFKVIYKINIKNCSQASEKKLYIKIDNVLKKLKIKNFYCVMLHNGEVLKKKIGPKIHNFLLNLKKIKKTNKIGISTYDINATRSIINKFKFDILQFPFNIFDQRLRDKNLLKFLKKKKIKIHIRSIFLQGLLLMDKDEINKKFLKKIKIIDEWLKFLKKKKLSNLEACITFIKNFDFYDHVIIGFDSYSHFKEVKKIYNKKNIIKINFDKFKNNSQLIYPQKWKLR